MISAFSFLILILVQPKQSGRTTLCKKLLQYMSSFIEWWLSYEEIIDFDILPFSLGIKPDVNGNFHPHKYLAYNGLNIILMAMPFVMSPMIAPTRGPIINCVSIFLSFFVKLEGSTASII